VIARDAEDSFEDTATKKQKNEACRSVSSVPIARIEPQRHSQKDAFSMYRLGKTTPKIGREPSGLISR
jgi:hypothetical protein